MSKATHTPTTSRRGLLAGSGVGALLAGIGLPATAAPVIATTGADPVVALYAKWRAVEDQHAALDQQHVALRADFVRRHGESSKNPDAWDHDPRRVELTALTRRCNDLSDASTDLIDAMQETPATSIEGVRCKMLVALDVWKFLDSPHKDPDTIEYQDEMTVAFLRDAVRVLGGSMPA